MDEQNTDDLVLAAKAGLKPVMEKQPGNYECLLCGEKQSVDGVCPNDGLPLRRLS